MDASRINLQLVIEGCRQGNAQSQRKLYEYFYGYGMSICLRYAKNERQAEEILQDGFLNAFRNLDRYDPDYPFKYWLRRILINAAIDYFRKYRRYHQLFVSAAIDEQEVNDHTEFPGFENDERALPILQKLPPAYRMVFNLYVMEGYKHHEIAEALGISVGTSKSNLARAKAKLRKWLTNKKKTAN